MKRVLAACGVAFVLASQPILGTPQPSWAVPAANAVNDNAVTSRDCIFPDTPVFNGPTVISDLADGLSSDGRGPYIQGTDDVVGSVVSAGAALTIFHAKSSSVQKPRTYSVNLDYPVRGRLGRPLGIVQDTNGSGIGLMTQWSVVGDTFKSLHNIPVGKTVTAAMMSVAFRLDGRVHILQMGPLPNGHCHNGGRTLVTGKGTTPGTIHRIAKTRWEVDLPAGSIGRLFDVTDGTDHAVDRGLYHFRLHYAIGN